MYKKCPNALAEKVLSVGINFEKILSQNGIPHKQFNPFIGLLFYLDAAKAHDIVIEFEMISAAVQAVSSGITNPSSTA